VRSRTTPWRKRQINAAIHLDRHNARSFVLFLYRNSSASCPPEVQRALAGDNGSSGLRARFSGTPKYTRMDAYLPAFAMALCNLFDRCRRRSTRLGLDWWPDRVLPGLLSTSSATLARFLRPVSCLLVADRWSDRRHGDPLRLTVRQGETKHRSTCRRPGLPLHFGGRLRACWSGRLRAATSREGRADIVDSTPTAV